MKRVLVVTVAVLAMLAAVPAASSAQESPGFKLGFKTLADMIPAIVGTPLEEEHSTANGDSLQRTSTGLMVWRKADNWTAFTDGARTWINGPSGLQDRLNSDRLPWEAQTAVAPSTSGEITVWDRRSVATAYIAAADDNTIYLWTGEPVAYLLDDHVYGFNGRHLGWYQDGIIWDYEAVSVGFTRQAPYVAQTSEPPKAAKQPRPARLPREAAPPEPPKTLGVYTTLLSATLRFGIVP